MSSQKGRLLATLEHCKRPTSVKRFVGIACLGCGGLEAGPDMIKDDVDFPGLRNPIMDVVKAKAVLSKILCS